MHSAFQRTLIGCILTLAGGMSHAFESVVLTPSSPSVVINYDLGGETPAPPYEGLMFGFTLSSPGGSTYFSRFYPEPNAGGTSLSGCGAPATGSIQCEMSFFDDPSYLGYADGVVSARVTLVSGDGMSIDGATLAGRFYECGIEDDSCEVSSQTQAVDGTVPSPATLALLGLGLAGLGVARRRNLQ